MPSRTRPLAIAVVAVAVAVAFSGIALAGPGPALPGPGDGRLLVSPDGKVLFVQRTTTKSGSTITTAETLVALSTSGTVAWTWTPPAAIHGIAFTTGIAAVAVGGDPISRTATTPSQIVGLDLATGNAAWTLSPEGDVRGLEAASNGVLAVVVNEVARTSTTPPSATRTLELVTPAGAVAWTYALD
jgi:hypothetical protein